MLVPLRKDTRVRLPDRRLKVRKDLILLAAFTFRKPLEGFEDKRFDRINRQGAGVLASGVAAHAVGDNE
jgi:hypothetical protein